MAAELFSIVIDGEEINDLYGELLNLEVELDDELASMFRLRFSLVQQPDGLWNHLDEGGLLHRQTYRLPSSSIRYAAASIPR